MKDEAKYANFVAAVQEAQANTKGQVLVHADHEKKFFAWLSQYCEPERPNTHPSFLGIPIIITRAIKPGTVMLLSQDADGRPRFVTLEGLELQP